MTEEWSVKERDEWVDILHIKTNVQHSVLTSRLSTAQYLLSPLSISQVFELSEEYPCTCSQPCEYTVSKQLVLNLRESLCVRTKEQQYDDIVSKLQAINVDKMEHNKNVQKKHIMKYKIHNVFVCRNFFTRALGCGHTTINRLRKRVLGETVVGHVREISFRESHQYDTCLSFWSQFFKAHCQSPRKGLRLFR